MKLHAVAPGGPPEGHYGGKYAQRWLGNEAPRSGPRRAPGGSLREEAYSTVAEQRSSTQWPPEGPRRVTAWRELTRQARDWLEDLNSYSCIQ